MSQAIERAKTETEMKGLREHYDEPHAPTAAQLIDELEKAGITHLVSLVENWTVRLHEAVAAGGSKVKLIHTSREGEIIPIAAGLLTAGNKPAVMMQNSGFAESGDSTRLGIQLGLPVLFIIGYRDWRGGNPGWRGKYIEPLLKAMDIPYEIVHDHTQVSAVGKAIKRAEQSSLPVAVLLPGVGGTQTSKTDLPPGAPQSKRMGYVESLQKFADRRTNEIVVAESVAGGVWPVMSKNPELDLVNLPCMGKNSSFALGIALANPDRGVWNFDGDGSLLMNLGALATEAELRPRNLVHLVVQNFSYEITANQPFPGSDCLDFEQIALGCGIKRAFTFDDIRELEKRLPEITDGSELTFVVLKVNLAGNCKKIWLPALSPENLAKIRETLNKA